MEVVSALQWYMVGSSKHTPRLDAAVPTPLHFLGLPMVLFAHPFFVRVVLLPAHSCLGAPSLYLLPLADHVMLRTLILKIITVSLVIQLLLVFVTDREIKDKGTRKIIEQDTRF